MKKSLSKFEKKDSKNTPMKLTPEKILSLLGKSDISSIEEVTLPAQQVQEIGSLAACKSLKRLHLQGNRFQVWRNLEGIFTIPALESLDLSNAPICLKPKYKEYVISHCPPTLKYLDRKLISDTDRRNAEKEFPNARANISVNKPQTSQGRSSNTPEDIFAAVAPTAKKPTTQAAATTKSSTK